jgi:hypothetical protein
MRRELASAKLADLAAGSPGVSAGRGGTSHVVAAAR